MRDLFVLSTETAITLSGGTEAATGLGTPRERRLPGDPSH